MEVAEIRAPGGKEVTQSLLLHEYLLLLFFVLCLPCMSVVLKQFLEMVCVEQVVCTCSG